jgi:hypothetical protein
MYSKTAAAVAALLTAACGNGAAGNNVSYDVTFSHVTPETMPAPAAPVADLSGARRLIDTIYTPYTRDQIVDYFRYFTPELNAAIDHAGEGAIEVDPLCGCQDMTHFTYRVQSLDATAGGAVARVGIVNFGEPKTIVLHLVRRGGAWLIADIGEGASSFAAGLRR